MPGQGWNDDGKRVGRITAKAGRVREHWNELVEIVERPGPTVWQKDRHRRWPFAGLMDEVNFNTANLNLELRRAVEELLLFSPIEQVFPILNQLAQVCLIVTDLPRAASR